MTLWKEPGSIHTPICQPDNRVFLELRSPFFPLYDVPAQVDYRSWCRYACSTLTIHTLHGFRLSIGVIGLTTALKLQEAGYSVTIIAEIFPTDPKNVKYTSQWAVRPSLHPFLHHFGAHTWCERVHIMSVFHLEKTCATVRTLCRQGIYHGGRLIKRKWD